jgi:hypothetical protein
MGVASVVAEKAIEFAAKALSPAQVCWACLIGTIVLGWFFTSHYARAEDVVQLREELAEQKSDAIAKRIFDYRVRQCDTPPEQRQEKRWLAEQLRNEAVKFEKVTGRRFDVPACGDL